MGCIWKTLEKGFSEMYGLGGEGGIFFRKLATTVDDLGFVLPVLVRAFFGNIFTHTKESEVAVVWEDPVTLSGSEG